MPSGGSGATASNLAPGNYSVEVTDNTGCTVVSSVTVNPASEIVLSSTIQAADCGESNGSIPNETTTYFLTVIDQNGCIGQDSVTVFVTSPCVDLALPTIFSPNGDGNNDEFCILGNCIQSAQLTIYNRWGEVVFNSTGNGECWDGTHRDKPVNTGVFIYKLRAIRTDGTELLETGSVTLVR